MVRNRTYKFLAWNVRGLNGSDKCAAVKAFLRSSKCGVICLQETKLAHTSRDKFFTFCGFHLRDFRSLDATGTRGGILTAWNPSLFECIEDWVGRF